MLEANPDKNIERCLGKKPLKNISGNQTYFGTMAMQIITCNGMSNSSPKYLWYASWFYSALYVKFSADSFPFPRHTCPSHGLLFSKAGNTIKSYFYSLIHKERLIKITVYE